MDTSLRELEQAKAELRLLTGQYLHAVALWLDGEASTPEEIIRLCSQLALQLATVDRLAALVKDTGA